MYLAYKFRMYPNDKQKELINKSFGCGRLIYNHYLAKIKEEGYTNCYTNIKDYTSKLKYDYPFLQEIDSIIIRKEIFNLEDNLKRYYNNGFGYPKFKSKYKRNSYTTNAVYRNYKYKNYCNIELDLENKLIKLPKLNKVKIRGYRKLTSIEGRIINATISKEINEKYYVSVVFEQPNKNKKALPNSIVGIDIGIK